MLHVEQLSDRIVPAVLVVTPAGLTYNGSSGDDTVTVSVTTTGVYSVQSSDKFTTIPAGWSGLETNLATGKLASPSVPMTFNLKDGDDVFNLRSTRNPVTVNGGDGENTINISSAAPVASGSLAGILAPVTINPGESDTLNVSDSTATSGNANVLIDGDGIHGFAGANDGQDILFGDGVFAAINVRGSSSGSLAEVFNVDAANIPASSFYLFSNGPDTVNYV